MSQLLLVQSRLIESNLIVVIFSDLHKMAGPITMSPHYGLNQKGTPEHMSHNAVINHPPPDGILVLCNGHFPAHEV